MSNTTLHPRPPFKFYLGSHNPAWLETADVPLCVSHARLAGRRSLPRARHGWLLDSGGFNELALHGGWRQSAREYAAAVRRYHDEVGLMRAAAPQDWMCEWEVLRKTGKSLRQHIELTVANFVELRSLAPDLPIFPVVQGWTYPSYFECIRLFERAGVDLSKEPLVGVGSICRRPRLLLPTQLLAELARAGYRVHAFGFKKAGLKIVHKDIVSADSLAWSYGGRYEPGCEGSHKRENNCLRHALWWRQDLLNHIAEAQRTAQ
ncbi:hypothetical protein SMD44_p10210 (plasmid) [Streptomyces alboflavus]|uniref:DeoxyPurine in DNA protein A domain-containing protein n=1 Tax=Streptomyces alboflavus TaxID=67267 RepID=A0A291W560_9ACTN|nr:hypothetical protein [Streptomyces alboflavus]ATM24709.1 hypothetical protein SMD44_p10210 [Streptomyces alboflavus]